MDKVERNEAETLVEQLPTDIPDDVLKTYNVIDDVEYGSIVERTLCVAFQVSTLYH